MFKRGDSLTIIRRNHLAARRNYLWMILTGKRQRREKLMNCLAKIIIHIYHNYLCIRRSIFPDFLPKSMGAYYTREVYNQLLFWLHSLPYLRRNDQNKVFYAVTKKYQQECVFVYNTVSPKLNLFLLQACFSLVWTCQFVYSKCCVNFVF